MRAASPSLEQDTKSVSADAPNRSVSPSGTGPGAGFPRTARLLRHSDFERVYKQGRRHFSSQMTVFYLRQGESGARIGFTVGRVLGGAVARNRIRRRMREAVRLERMRLTVPVDVVINPKKSVLTAPFQALVDEIAKAFDVISSKVGR